MQLTPEKKLTRHSRATNNLSDFKNQEFSLQCKMNKKPIEKLSDCLGTYAMQKLFFTCLCVSLTLFCNSLHAQTKENSPKTDDKPKAEVNQQANQTNQSTDKTTTITATTDNAKTWFNGKDLTGWDMDDVAKESNVWSVENGEIIGKSDKGLKRNAFLTSQLEISDFKLSLKIKLNPNTENSGIQIRSVRIEKGEMRGPQCDAGKGWWGKLYEESGRGLLWKEDREEAVKQNDWNEYVIEAKGNTIKTTLNGKECVNLTDDKLSRKGLIGLQVHSGKVPIEVRFKDLKLEIYEEKK